MANNAITLYLQPGHYPDLNRKDVRLWWGEQYKDLISLGLEFVWQDMTSPCMGASYGDMKRYAMCFKLEWLFISLLYQTASHSE